MTGNGIAAPGFGAAIPELVGKVNEGLRVRD
jgi:hypothetical protein